MSNSFSCVECGRSHEHVSGRYCSFGYCACTIDASDRPTCLVEQSPSLCGLATKSPSLLLASVGVAPWVAGL
jgi:hypothetical protein